MAVAAVSTIRSNRVIRRRSVVDITGLGKGCGMLLHGQVRLDVLIWITMLRTAVYNVHQEMLPCRSTTGPECLRRRPGTPALTTCAWPSKPVSFLNPMLSDADDGSNSCVDQPARRSHPQPESDRRRSAAQAPDRGDRAQRRGQELAGVRHPLRRGPPALCRDIFALRPPVLRQARQARCRHHLRNPAGDRRGPAPRPKLAPHHGRHHHRDSSLTRLALCTGRPGRLSPVRPACCPCLARDGRSRHR